MVSALCSVATAGRQSGALRLTSTRYVVHFRDIIRIGYSEQSTRRSLRLSIPSKIFGHLLAVFRVLSDGANLRRTQQVLDALVAKRGSRSVRGAWDGRRPMYLLQEFLVGRGDAWQVITTAQCGTSRSQMRFEISLTGRIHRELGEAFHRC